MEYTNYGMQGHCTALDNQTEAHWRSISLQDVLVPPSQITIMMSFILACCAASPSKNILNITTVLHLTRDLAKHFRIPGTATVFVFRSIPHVLQCYN
jgi:hypothetical protein